MASRCVSTLSTPTKSDASSLTLEAPAPGNSPAAGAFVYPLSLRELSVRARTPLTLLVPLALLDLEAEGGRMRQSLVPGRIVGAVHMHGVGFGLYPAEENYAGCGGSYR